MTVVERDGGEERELLVLTERQQDVPMSLRGKQPEQRDAQLYLATECRLRRESLGDLVERCWIRHVGAQISQHGVDVADQPGVGRSILDLSVGAGLARIADSRCERFGRIIGACRSVMGDDTVPCPRCEPKLAGLVLLVRQPHVLKIRAVGETATDEREDGRSGCVSHGWSGYPER